MGEPSPGGTVRHALLLVGAAATTTTSASSLSSATAKRTPAASSTADDRGKKRKATTSTAPPLPPLSRSRSPSPSPSEAQPEARVDLDVVLPGGTQGIRAPLLTVNWVRRVGNRVQGKPGRFMAVLLDRGRIPASIITELERSIGYDAREHDPVVFFERRGRRLVGSFGAVLRGTGQLWSPQAYEEMSARDASAAWAFQAFLETDAFNWLECERCRKWRMYPHEDVILPGEEEGAVFVCELASTWNPVVRGCGTEQEVSFDSMDDPEASSEVAGV